MTISGGIGQVKAEGDTAEDLFKRADAALYKAKEGGRNQIVSGE